MADPLLVRAARLEQVERTPVWYMRQAGRSLPEYRAIREQHDLFAICRHPELCAEVTLQPVARHGVDAAVIYSDIVLPVTGMGALREPREGVGPVLDAPLRTAGDLRRLYPLAAGARRCRGRSSRSGWFGRRSTPSAPSSASSAGRSPWPAI